MFKPYLKLTIYERDADEKDDSHIENSLASPQNSVSV